MVMTRSQAKAAAAAAAAAASGGTASAASAASAAVTVTSQGTTAITEDMAALRIGRKNNVDSNLDDLLRGEPEISDALYNKAAKDNKSLSKLERILLFSRCDIWGKAFADPDSLTEGQRNIVLSRPPPEIMAQNIRDATDGAMSTVAELRSVDVKALGLPAMFLIFHCYQTSDRNGRATMAFEGPFAKRHDEHFTFLLPERDDEHAFAPPYRAIELYRSPEEIEWEMDVFDAINKVIWDADDDSVESDPNAELVGYREEKERLEPEMRAQLAEKIGQLSEVEKAELAELVRAERERNKAEEEAFEALLDEHAKKAPDESGERELNRQIAREERKEAKKKMREIQKEKRKRLGIYESDDDDDEDDEATETDSSCTDGGKSLHSDDSRD
ncbi:hypothetical protein RB595_007368 [Gaeumannomyces hyphopodioides]